MILGDDLEDVRRAQLAGSTISAEGELTGLEPLCCKNCTWLQRMCSRSVRRARRLGLGVGGPLSDYLDPHA